MHGSEGEGRRSDSLLDSTWMDNRKVGKYDLNKYCAVLAKEFSFAEELNSMARQAAAERAWSAISRFYENCKKKKPGKKEFPKFKKRGRSVEYKTSGWKLSENRKAVTFSDDKNIGTLKLKGTYDLNYYDIKQIKRIRLVRRADGYYAQFAVEVDARVDAPMTGKMIGLDVGLQHFIADSNGNTIEEPQFYRKSERQLKRTNRKKSKKFKKGAIHQSKNYHKARARYARKQLRVSRRRNEYCKQLAYCVIQANDLIAYEDLNVKDIVRNRHRRKSISDAGWSTFRNWLEYFGIKYGKVTVAVPPHHTFQSCSNCGAIVKKSLSVRTHVCPHCGYIGDRDVNASINILRRALRTVGHTGTYAWGNLPSWAVGVNLLSNGELMNQESPRL